MAKVIIWECEGEPYRGVRYGDRIEERLRLQGIPSERVCYPSGTVSWQPQHQNGLAHVWTGGVISALAPNMKPWKKILAAQIDQCLAGGPPVVGICLGAQMIAETYASLSGKGSVIRECGKGMEIGHCKIQSICSDIEERIGTSSFYCCQYHYHEIDPTFLGIEGIKLLCKNSHTEVQAFSIDQRVFGFQFHLDFRSTDCRQVLKSYLSDKHKNLSVLKDRKGSVENQFQESLFEILVLSQIM